MIRETNCRLTELPQVQEALEDLQDRLLTLFPGQISQLLLYGSYSRGEATPESDIDVMVVVGWEDPKHPHGLYLGGASDPRWRKIIDTAIDVMIDHGPYISVLVVGENVFNSGLPVAQAAKEEGQVLWMKQPI
jgi:predicted nucleotidyltransferase